MIKHEFLFMSIVDCLKEGRWESKNSIVTLAESWSKSAIESNE